MHADVTEPVATVVPTLRYRDVAAAIDWLCKAFGFHRHLVVNGEGGGVRYAELTNGFGMVMLAPVEDSAFDKLMTQPGDIGGAETQICYLFVDDVSAHCARAKAAGADIVLDIEDEHSSGRGYSCRDLEGHIWNFGTYNPWKRHVAPAGGAPGRHPGPSRRRGGALRRLALGTGLLVTVIGSAVVVGWALGVSEQTLHDLGPGAPASASSDAMGEREQLAREQTGREAAERAVKSMQEQLARERSGKEAAERARAAREQAGEQAAKAAQAQSAQERQAREASERTAKEAREQLGRERDARQAAERAAKEAQAQSAQERQRAAIEAHEQLAKAGGGEAVGAMRQELARERSALEAAERAMRETRDKLSAAERAADTAREQLAAERSAREAAERASQHAQEQLAKERSIKASAEQAAKEARERKERSAKEAAEQRAREEREARERKARRAAPAPRQRAAPAEPAASSAPFVNWQQGS